MLAVTRKFETPEMERAFRQFLSWSVRFLIVGGAGGGKLERYYGVRAKDVTDGKIASASKLAEDMSDVLPNDKQFQEEFSKASVRKSNLARYYLKAIEAFLADDPDPMLLINEDPNAVNLEHAMPVTPGDEWKNFDADTLAVYHKRIGNMVLLGSKTNVKLGNSGFENKRKILAQVSLRTTSEVAKCEVWGPDQIRERQARFAELSPKIWPLTWK